MFVLPRIPTVRVIQWTLPEICGFVAYSAGVVFLYDFMGFEFLRLPWAPVAVLGTALAFILGFRNNAAYDRIWEARKIWGGIVNSSRSWGMKVEVMVNNDHTTDDASDEEIAGIRKTLVYRHIAWMAALRYSMRQSKSWEVNTYAKNAEGQAKMLGIPEKLEAIEDVLAEYLSEEETDYVLGKDNKQTALLYLQSRHLRKLQKRGLLWSFAFIELEELLEELFTLQGKSERIKNFPYPRQYATLSHEFLRIFFLLLPFAVVPSFATIATELASEWATLAVFFVWISVPFCAVISWVFHILEKIGKFGENPFEGTANDVPISSISRGIEINMRQMLDEDHDTIPGKYEAFKSIHM